MPSELTTRPPAGHPRTAASGFQLSRPARWEYLLPALAICSLLASCIIISGKKHYWNDELFSYFMTSEPSFGRMLAAFHDKLNNTPFLYFLLGWSWDKVFGSSEVSLRLFSSLGFGAALWLVWRTLRRSYGVWPTSVGVFLTFCTSSIVLQQNAEARMYGLFVALVAAAFMLYDTAQRQPAFSVGWLLLHAAVHAAIVHTHLFGFFYSGALLAALLVTDRLARQFRPKLYLSLILGCATIIFYLPSFLIQADAGKPNSWMPIPGVRDLTDMYGLTSPHVFRRVVLVPFLLLLAYFFVRFRRRPRLPATQKTTRIETAHLVVAAAFVAMPVFVWVFSQFVKSIYVPRYMVPTLVGWAIPMVMLASRTLPTFRGLSRHTPSSRPATPQAGAVESGLFYSFLVVLLLYPLQEAVRTRPTNAPSHAIVPPAIDRQYAGLPRVLLNSSFLAHQYYDGPGHSYYYILDWSSALSPDAGPWPTQEYKHMEAWKRQFPHLFQRSILTSEDFLAQHDRFLVIDLPDYLHKCPPAPKGLLQDIHTTWDVYLNCPQWVEMRLLTDPRYKVTVLARQVWNTVLLVEKQSLTTARN